jgi:hypothetical protein
MLYDGCVGRSAAEVRGASRSGSNCQFKYSFRGLCIHLLSSRMSAYGFSSTVDKSSSSSYSSPGSTMSPSGSNRAGLRCKMYL